MKWKEYEELASRTLSKKFNITGVEDLLHAAIGFSTEAGELLDIFKKLVYYEKPVDIDNLKEEIGDAFWYLSIFTRLLDLDPHEIMEENIAKLKQRYPEKFTTEDAINRDYDKEKLAVQKSKQNK
jgi:NTP pyrophosphatase (non-canonical NTP hydrolase)